MQKRVLLADSDRLCLNAMADLLVKSGFTCHCETTAQGTITRLVQGQPFDCLVTEVDVPGNEKLGMVGQVANLDSMLPVIVVTGCPTQESAVAAIELNVESYLIKPVDPAHLLEKVANAARMSRIRRQTSHMLTGMQKSHHELKCFESHLRTSRAVSPVIAAHALFDLATKNLISAMLDIKEILQAAEGLTSSKSSSSADSELKDALLHAVSVLQSTKNSFKSRQIAELRQMLEQKLKKL